MESKFLTTYSEITFLDKITFLLSSCSSFSFSVSFIKKAGLVLLLDSIKDALKRGVHGRIITSTYQNFTDIPSLQELLALTNQYPNFECHIDYQSFGENGFHTKGYLFELGLYSEIIIGSTNITRFALRKNIEWNVSISSIKQENEIFINEVNEEFESLWAKTLLLSDEIINQYSITIEYAVEKWDMDYLQNTGSVTPNFMQRKALKEIRRYRDMGVDKALVIAATGSGKTYLAAFDARNFGAKRLLFIVHRDTILNEARDTFSKVFPVTVSHGLFNGNNKDIDSDFLYATNTSMSTHLDLFTPDEFDYIILDEVHHAVASTYQKIIQYFKPQFLLGLTATPERMDQQSIFDIFEKNVPYELRLRDALINDLVVPFSYYGIKDQLVDYSLKDINVLVRQIANDLHCEFIKDQIELHRSRGKLKALGFCRTIEHARQMADAMALQGYHTTYLSGRNDTGERLKAFHDLQDDQVQLEIIFTVDLLNEGIDIPAVNMVLFLRPTESSTIFIQQLGRGLRKFNGKEKLVVLDFIGNSYQRSVQIAIALGSLSSGIGIDKKLLANYIRDDFRVLNLPIEINIDELSKEEILKSIEATNFNSFNFLKQDYLNYKKYLNKYLPLTHMDFLNSENATDLLRMIKMHGSYYNFLCKIQDEELPEFNEKERDFLEYASSLLPLIRPYEYQIIQSLIDGPKTADEIITECGLRHPSNQFDHALNHLQNKYYSKNEQDGMKQFIVQKGDLYYLLESRDNSAYKNHLLDLIQYGLTRYQSEFYDCNDQLKRYGNYTRKQFLQTICSHTMTFREGLFWGDDKLYLFIDLKKDLSKQEWLLYEDKFINPKTLQWESSTSTTLENKKGEKLISQKIVEVFVRKIKMEDGVTLPYIYIGKGELTNTRAGNNSKLTLLFDINLEYEVPAHLKYDFQIEE